jgi:hypothetical protein
MIKAEIITDASVYRLDLHDFEDVKVAYEYVFNELCSPDAAVFEGQDGILCIDLVNSKVKSYRVWREVTPLDRLAATAPEIQGPPTEPWTITQPVKFLGRKIGLEALAYELNGQRFVMPLALDGRAPHDALNESSLRQLLAANFPDAEAVIPPPVTLTAAEAVAFLMDYAESAAPELPVSGEINARAAGAVFE